MPTFFNSPLFETAICMVLIFALLSLLASSIVEVVNTYFKEREKMLYTTISRMFDDNINVNFGQLLYSHPIIENLRKDRTSLPRYIDPEIFSNVLIDVINNQGREYAFDEITHQIELKIVPTLGNNDVFNNFYRSIMKMKHTDLKLVLLNICEKSLSTKEPLDELHLLLRQWYNSQMDRLTGWYKEKTGKSLWWVAALVAILMNVNSIQLFKSLYKDPVLRQELTPVAEMVADNYQKLSKDSSLTERQRMLESIKFIKPADSIIKDTNSANLVIAYLKKMKEFDSIRRDIDSSKVNGLIKQAQNQAEQISAFNLPIGWKTTVPPLTKGMTVMSWLQYLFGIFLTCYALKAGAPFWFQILVRFVNIRKAGPRPDTTNEKNIR